MNNNTARIEPYGMPSLKTGILTMTINNVFQQGEINLSMVPKNAHKKIMNSWFSYTGTAECR